MTTPSTDDDHALMVRKRFENRFHLNEWFQAWRDDLDKTHDAHPEPRHVLPLRETVVEALSDASAEQFLNPLAARHLRRYGHSLFEHASVRFWVRSEWGKVDLCYGVAPADGFPGDWEAAWTSGHTGDLGQIEVKVLYAHEALSSRNSKLEVLAAQLEARAKYDREVGRANRIQQSYHGLVWIFEHGDDGKITGIGKEVTARANTLQMKESVSFRQSCDRIQLGDLWPAFGGEPYRCRLDLALFEFHPTT